jgi:hypothetical protein
MVLQACEEMGIDDGARALLTPQMSPRAAVDALLTRGHPQEALQLLARLLPKRYVVAWLCQCSRSEDMPEDDRAGAVLAEQWVRDPTEPHRRVAYEFATGGGYRTLGTWLAAAAGWSGGSLAPATQQTPVQAPAHLTARAAVAAINLLAAMEPDRFDERRLAFAARALPLLEESNAAGS